MMKLISILKRDYPNDQNIKRQFLLGLVFGLWIFLFLWLSDAFELYQLSTLEKLKRLSMYASVSIISYLVSLLYQSYRVRNTRQWVVGTELVLLVIACVAASILVYGVFLFFGNENPRKLYFLNYLLTVYLPSLIIILPFLTVGRFLLGKFGTSKRALIDNKILIIGSNDNEGVELNFKDLVYLNASGNYVEIHYLSRSVLEKKIIRGKLLDIETQFPQLYRTHRSYLINPNFFKGFTKEKTNLFIDLGFEARIPVARNMKKKAQKELPFKTKR